MRSRSMVALCSSSGLATTHGDEDRDRGAGDDARGPVDQALHGVGGHHDAAASTRRWAVARRPGGDGEPVEVEQRLVGYVDRQRRREPRRHHREEDQQRPRDPGVPAQQGRQGAAREDGEPADDPHRGDLVATVDRQRAADAGHHGGGDAGGAEDRRQQVHARLVEGREGGGRGEGRRGGGALAGVPADRQDADERAREQDPDGDGADRVLARAAGVPRGEGGDERGDRWRSSTRAPGSRARSWPPRAA